MKHTIYKKILVLLLPCLIICMLCTSAFAVETVLGDSETEVEEIDIFDEPVPLANNVTPTMADAGVQTTDDMPNIVFIIVAGLSLGGTLITVVVNKTQK